METDSLPIADQKPPKLRWFQFRLRSLFILTTLVAIGCSWLAVEMEKARKQRKAIEAIWKAGGVTHYEVTWLGRLLGSDSLARVTFVGLAGESTTDADLVHLQGFRQLRGLQLQKSNITDAGMVNLQGLTQLESLRLDNTKVTDAGLLYLQGLRHLQYLELDCTKVTDAGLLHLQGLRQLQTLYLGETKVSDAGLRISRG